MPLTVEDGSMPDAANSYVTLLEADAYLVPRGLWQETPETDSDNLTSQKESALMRAFDALNILVWRGDLPTYDRTVAWPRQNVTLPGKPHNYLPENVIPSGVKQAQMELAALMLSGTANPLAPMERGGRYSSKSKSSTDTVDVLTESKSESVAYADTAPVETYLPSVYGLLRPWLAVVPGRGGLLCGSVVRA